METDFSAKIVRLRLVGGDVPRNGHWFFEMETDFSAEIVSFRLVGGDASPHPPSKSATACHTFTNKAYRINVPYPYHYKKGISYQRTVLLSKNWSVPYRTYVLYRTAILASGIVTHEHLMSCNQPFTQWYNKMVACCVINAASFVYIHIYIYIYQVSQCYRVVLFCC